VQDIGLFGFFGHSSMTFTGTIDREFSFYFASASTSDMPDSDKEK
jgi:hypothetical protein